MLRALGVAEAAVAAEEEVMVELTKLQVDLTRQLARARGQLGRAGRLSQGGPRPTPRDLGGEVAQAVPPRFQKPPRLHCEPAKADERRQHREHGEEGHPDRRLSEPHHHPEAHTPHRRSA